MSEPLRADRCGALLAEVLGAPPADVLLALHVQPPGGAAPWQCSWGNAAHGSATGSLRIASVTKTFVAAAALRLLERGHWRLEEPIAAHLPPARRAQLEAAGLEPAVITLRMLLDHTSGVPDFVGEDYVAQLVAAPAKHWSRDEQLALAMTRPRVGAPGERYVYCDANYSLLGELVERAAGVPLAAAVRRWSGLEELGLRQTWWETLEPAPPGLPPRLAQTYVHGDTPMPVADFDASIDLYGGGGLVSTLPNLARFFRALVEGELFTRPETTAAMRTASPQSRAAGGVPYALGLELLESEGVTCWGHRGYWGVAAWHCPEAGFTFTATITNTARKELLWKLQHEVVALFAAR